MPVAVLAIFSLLLLLAVSKEGAAFYHARVDELYACSERWERMANSRRCPPTDVGWADVKPSAVIIASYEKCFEQNAQVFEQNFCDNEFSSRLELETFAKEFDEALHWYLPRHLGPLATPLTTLMQDACRNSSTATLRSLFDEMAVLAFIDDVFVSSSPDRIREVQSMNRHYLCHGWLNFSLSSPSFLLSDDQLDANNELTLTSYLKCAGTLHQAAIDQLGYIMSADKFYLAAEIGTAVLAVFAVALNIVSIIGVWFALGLSRFRRALMLNLIITDLTNVLTIAIDDNFNLPRVLDASYYIWNILTFETILTLCLLTLDFNLAIFKPNHYEVLLPRSATLAIIGASWLCSVGLAMMFIFGAKQHSAALAIAVLCCYLLGILLIFAAHLILIFKIFIIQKSHETVALNAVPHDHQQHKNIIEETYRVSATIALCAVTTLVLVTPYVAYEFNIILEDIDAADPEVCIINESHRLIIEMVADISLCLNGVIDPLLYVMRLSDVRKGLRRAFRKFMRRSGLSQRFPTYTNSLFLAMPVPSAVRHASLAVTNLEKMNIVNSPHLTSISSAPANMRANSIF